jgi:hypothetical protein
MKMKTKRRKKRRRKRKKVITDMISRFRDFAISGFQITRSRNHEITRSVALLVLLLAAACVLPAHADSRSDARKPYALLFGTVYNAANHPVYGVKIKIRRADKKRAKWELYSDHQGEFAQRVPAGKADYVISTEAKKGQPAAETTIHIDADERKDFSLRLK